MVLVYLAFCIWSLFGYLDNGWNEKKDTILFVCLFVFFFFFVFYAVSGLVE